MDIFSLPIIQQVFFWVFLGLFVVASILHLIYSFRENAKLRRWTKPFCLLFLGAAICAMRPDAYLIYIGAWLGCIGDTLLIKKKKKFFIMGASSFLLGHLCYIAHTILFLQNAGIMQWWGPLIVVGVGIVIVIIAIFPLRDFVTKNIGLAVAGAFYVTALLLLLGIAVTAVACGYWKFFIVMAIGALLFIGSDTLLSFTIFRHDIKRKDFYIMLSYLLAELGVLFGLALSVL